LSEPSAYRESNIYTNFTYLSHIYLTYSLKHNFTPSRNRLELGRSGVLGRGRGRATWVPYVKSDQIKKKQRWGVWVVNIEFRSPGAGSQSLSWCIAGAMMTPWKPMIYAMDVDSNQPNTVEMFSTLQNHRRKIYIGRYTYIPVYF
jgi:hypothetical protein